MLVCRDSYPGLGPGLPLHLSLHICPFWFTQADFLPLLPYRVFLDIFSFYSLLQMARPSQQTLPQDGRGGLRTASVTGSGSNPGLA